MDGAPAQGTLYTHPTARSCGNPNKEHFWCHTTSNKTPLAALLNQKNQAKKYHTQLKGVNVRDHRTQCQGEPEEKPKQLEVEIHSNSRSLSANNNSVSPRRSAADVKRADPNTAIRRRNTGCHTTHSMSLRCLDMSGYGVDCAPPCRPAAAPAGGLHAT